MSKTHWKRLINPDYIGAYSLDEGCDLTVTITHVGLEEVKGEGGKKEQCTVARLHDQKPLILNRTNQKSIARLYGPYIEDWIGKQITLFATTTKVARETVECLRVRPQVAVQKQPITDDRLNKAIEAILTGDYELAKLNAQFELTQEQRKRINEAIK